MVKYDAVIVLSSNYPDQKVLTPIAAERLEIGLDIAYAERVRQIGLLGSLSDKMFEYLTNNGIQKERIIHENVSRDTVGNIVALELLLRRHQGWNSLALVSSDFHLDRVQFIRNKLYPNGFNIDYFPVESNGMNRSEKEKHEQLSLEAFNRDFGDVKSESDVEIIRRLMDVHEVYKDRRDKENFRSMLMRAL